MFKKFVMAAALSALTTLACAAPVTITQVFSDVTLDDYEMADGLTYGNIGTGDWIFKTTLDTEADNMYPWPDFAGYYAATVTLTQASLGLFDERIMNMSYFFIHSNMLGFTEHESGGAPWTRTMYSGLPLGTGHFPFAAGDVFHSSHEPDNGFGPQWSGFQFENGARIYGWGYDAQSTVTVTDAAAVPEPAGVLLLIGALAGLAAARRRPAKV